MRRIADGLASDRLKVFASSISAEAFIEALIDVLVALLAFPAREACALEAGLGVTEALFSDARAVHEVGRFTRSTLSAETIPVRETPKIKRAHSIATALDIAALWRHAVSVLLLRL